MFDIFFSFGSFISYKYVGYPQLTGITGVEPEYWYLVWHVVDDVTVGKEDYGGVGGQEDQDVPDTMQVGEPETRPVGTEESIIQPSCKSQDNEPNTPLSQLDDPGVVLLLQLQPHQQQCGHHQQHQAESIHSWLDEAQEADKDGQDDENIGKFSSSIWLLPPPARQS